MQKSSQGLPTGESMRFKVSQQQFPFGSIPQLMPLSIDESCLHVSNADKQLTLDLWAQSKECYLCSPWKYLSLKPGENASLIVNSTYPTEFFVQQPFQQLDIHRYKYQFTQGGIYSLKFNFTDLLPIVTEHQGSNEYMSIFSAFAFVFMVYVFWGCIILLQAKMAERGRFQRRSDSGENDDSSNLLTSENSDPDIQSQSESINNLATSSTSSTQVCITTTTVSTSTNTTTTIKSSRLSSLDTFRGLSIILMIFVNYGGGKYYFFRHSPWNGLTTADLVFPWFLWIMGVSLTISIKYQLNRMTSRCTIILKIIKRSLILFALGIIVNSIKSNYLPTFRIPGVLQRFAFCYFINALMEALCMKRQITSTENFRYCIVRDIVWSWIQWMVTFSLLITSLAIMFALHIPGCPRGYLGPGGLHMNGTYPNCTGGAAGYIDQVVLGKNHIHFNPTCKNIYDNPGPFDPEGILGILTSCITVQLGVTAGRIIIYFQNRKQRLKRWLIWGTCLGLIGGFLCNWSKEGGLIPVNKNLWSLSYVCVTGSFAFYLILALYYIIDVKKSWNGTPFRVAGLNSILLYVGHEVTKNFFPWSWSPVEPFHSNHLAMNIWGTSLWVILAYICHKKQLYFSV